MVKFLIQRFSAMVARLVGAGVILLLLIELSFCVLGGSDRHVWLAESYEGDPGQFSYGAETWRELIGTRVGNSAKAWLIAYGSVLLFGYGWGILSARLRRLRFVNLLALPFNLFSCVPGFSFVVAVAVYSYFAWQRPGFAEELVVEAGPDLMGWWYASVVALPVLAPAVAWQMRSVSEAIVKQAGRPFVRGLYTAGHRDDVIFYGNVYREARPETLRLLDQTIPFLLGSLVVVEWAFRYEGLGSLLVECVIEGTYLGIFLCTFVAATLIGLATFAREVLVKLSGGK